MQKATGDENLQSVVKCYDCGKSFFNERFFEAHVKRRHSNENIIKNQEVTVSLLSRSAHTNNQYESRIFTMIFLFIYLQVNLCQKLFFFASINPKYDDRLFIELQVHT